MKKLTLVTVMTAAAMSHSAAGVSVARSAIPSAVDTVAQATSSGSPPEACALFTVEEVGKTLGRSFRRARPGKQPGATTCAFLGGTEGTINVSISPSSSKKEFDDFRKLLAEQGEKVETVSGVGDDAYYWGARIYVRVGNRWLVIWNGDPSQPVAKVRADVLSLAKVGAPRLR